MNRILALALAGLFFAALPATPVLAADAPVGGGFASFIPLILIFVVFYFLLIRPQQKKAKEHQAYLNDLKKGNKVVTSGGIYGEITGLTDSVLTLEIADNVRIKVDRGAIARPQVIEGAKQEGEKEKKVKGG